MRIIWCAHEGSCTPPNPLLVLKPSMLPKERRHHVITMFAGRECRADDYVCKLGGFAKPSLSAIKREHHVITMFAMRESCAKHLGQMGSCASPASQRSKSSNIYFFFAAFDRSKSSNWCKLQRSSVPSLANGVICSI